jgi:hypothetical protein
VCRVRCFGLPLYNAFTREALAQRLGLLLLRPASALSRLLSGSQMSALGQKQTFAAQQSMSAMGQKRKFSPVCQLINNYHRQGLRRHLMELAVQASIIHWPGRRSSDLPFMLALTVTPGEPNSLDLENVEPPPVFDGTVLVRMLTLGICGTDLEIRTSPDGVLCLGGVSSGGRELAFDVGAFNRTVVLENHTMFGSVSANRLHYQRAAEVLAHADQDWLSRLITRRTSLERWREAFHRNDGDIKVVIDFVD